MARRTLPHQDILDCLSSLMERLVKAIDYVRKHPGKIDFDVPDDFPASARLVPPPYCNTCSRPRPKRRLTQPDQDRRDVELLLGILKKTRSHRRK